MDQIIKKCINDLKPPEVKHNMMENCILRQRIFTDNVVLLKNNEKNKTNARTTLGRNDWESKSK